MPKENRSIFAPLVDLDENSRFFLIPHFVVFIGAAVWLAATTGQITYLPDERQRLVGSVLPLLLWFALYTVGMHTLSRRYPNRRRFLFQAVVVLDVAFITLLIRVTGALQSNFYLAYYPFIALEIFYFGIAGGAFVTCLSGAAYLALYLLNREQLFLGDFALRLGFMFLVFAVLAALEENARHAKMEIEQKRDLIADLKARLEERYHEMMEDREALANALTEKDVLLSEQNIISSRRRAQISFAKELNAQSDIARTASLFGRYVRDLLKIDRADLVIFKKDLKIATLYPSDPDEEVRDLPFDHPLITKVIKESDDTGCFEATWNCDAADDIPDSILVTPNRPTAMHIETLSGGRMGQNGILVFSNYTDHWFDPDLLDEMKILASHLTVAIENLTLRARLQDMADRDGLTGIFNRRYFQESLEREVVRARRYERPLSLILFDIDHFKKLNDTLGHQAGDTVLRDLGAIVRNMLREADVFCRYGGEEFVVILPETDKSGALGLAERIRRAVSKHSFRDTAGKPFGITISLGVSTMPPVAEKEALIKTADDALYRAKESGRNCVAS